MSSPPVNRTIASARTRESILDAAFERFRTGGLSAVTLRNVAELSGLSPMGIYRHFDNREALINALVDRGFEMLRIELQRVRASQGLSTVRGLSRTYIDFALSQPDLFDLMLLAHRPSDDPFLDDYKAGESLSFEILRSAIQQAMDSGELMQANSVEAAIVLWAQAHGLIALYVAGRFGKGEDQFRRFSLRCLNSVIDGMRPGRRK